MKIPDKTKWFQTLFEQMADAYIGTLVLDDISDEGCTVAFFDENEEVCVSRATFKIRDLGDRVVLRVVRTEPKHKDEEPVLVSPVISALIAVCTRPAPIESLSHDVANDDPDEISIENSAP